MRGKREPLEARFWSKVAKTDTCWLWTGGQNRNGYGVIHYYDGHREVAHRTSWRLAGRYLDPSLTLDHLCRVRHCVNPDHLEQVTNRENVLRGDTLPAKWLNRTHCLHGHEWTPENTGRHRKNRRCRACDRIQHEKSRSLSPDQEEASDG